MFRDDGIIYGRLGRSPITRFGMRTLTFGVRALTFALRTLTFRVQTLTFGVQTPSSVCDRCVRYANSKKSFLLLLDQSIVYTATGQQGAN